MRIFDNGTYRDMTPEEEASYIDAVEPGSGMEEIGDFEAYDIIFGGAE